MEIIKFEGDNIDLSSNSYIIKEGKNFCIVDPSVSIAMLEKTLGDFCIDGEQKNDGKATISREKQMDISISAVLDFIK